MKIGYIVHQLPAEEDGEFKMPSQFYTEQEYESERWHSEKAIRIVYEEIED